MLRIRTTIFVFLSSLACLIIGNINNAHQIFNVVCLVLIFLSLSILQYLLLDYYHTHKKTAQLFILIILSMTVLYLCIYFIFTFYQALL